MRGYLKTLVVASCLTLVNCSSAPPRPLVDITVEEVQQSEFLGQLQSHKATLTSQLAGKNPEKHPDAYLLLEAIKQRIAQLATQQLEQQLDQGRMSATGYYSNIVPLPILQDLQQNFATKMGITASLQAEIGKALQRESTLTHNAIAKLEEEASQEQVTPERRVAIYNQLTVISGDTKWSQARERQMEAFLRAIRKAVAANTFSLDLEKKVDFVRSIYITEPRDIVDEMYGVYAKLFAARYSDAIAKGSPKAAAEVLRTLSLKSDYPAILQKLEPLKKRMADDYAYFVGESIDQAWNVGRSYPLYMEAQDVRAILKLPVSRHVKTPQLAEQIATKLADFKGDQNAFAALGALYALESIDPYYPSIATDIANQQALIRNTTLSSVRVVTFRSRQDNNAIGEQLTRFLTEKLQQEAGRGFTVVTDHSAPDTSNADAAITGSVLEAKVDATQARNKKVLTVSVGKNQVSNPEYLKWLALPPKEREKTIKPLETLLAEKQESVTISSTLHKKMGLLAVSLRLMDTRNNQVIYPDSLTLQKAFEDESNEGLEVGDLNIPYKVADLPSDADIITGLAREAAQVIGSNILAILENQEKEYLKLADNSAAQKKCHQEVENLAKAVALLTLKNQGRTDLKLRLSEKALGCD